MHEFNPHHNKTADGIIIIPDLLVDVHGVVENTRGSVVEDTASVFFCKAGACMQDHWFSIECDGTVIEAPGALLRAVRD